MAAMKIAAMYNEARTTEASAYHLARISAPGTVC